MAKKYKKSEKPIAGETDNPLIPGNGERPGIDCMVIIAKFTDGKYKQVVLERKTERTIFDVIVALEKNIRVLNDDIVGIEFSRNK